MLCEKVTAGPSVGIAVVQECARPEVECDTRVWFGDNPGQSIAVLASNGYQIRALPTDADVPKFVFPLEVIGPVNFLLLVVWSKRKQKYRYVMGIMKAIRIYRDLIRNSLTVLISDFNSNAIWDAWHPPDLNHSALITLLSQLGLVSSYHHCYGRTMAQKRGRHSTCGETSGGPTALTTALSRSVGHIKSKTFRSAQMMNGRSIVITVRCSCN
jgi:hypothetical protein